MSGSLDHTIGMATATAVIDVDVHAALPVQLNAVLEYMPRAYREKLAYIGAMPLSSSPLNYTYLAGKYVLDPSVPIGELRTPPQAIESVGRELDGFGQLFAVEAMTHAMQSGNPDLSAAIVSAFNDFMLDQWLADSRLRYALAVSTVDPALAVEEIRRHGGDARVGSVWVPTTGERLAHQRAVLEAAVEHGLPVVNHPGSGRIAMTPGAYALEGRYTAPLAAWGELAALVAHGAFQALPDLKVAFLECGFAWLEALLARMDAHELVRQRVRVAGADPPALIERPDSILPDVVVYTRRGPDFHELSENLRARIMCDNAKAVVRL
jgi:uncharacterized protein